VKLLYSLFAKTEHLIKFDFSKSIISVLAVQSIHLQFPRCKISSQHLHNFKSAFFMIFNLNMFIIWIGLHCSAAWRTSKFDMYNVTRYFIFSFVRIFNITNSILMKSFHLFMNNSCEICKKKIVNESVICSLLSHFSYNQFSNLVVKKLNLLSKFGIILLLNLVIKVQIGWWRNVIYNNV